MAADRRSDARADRWQDRLDGLIVVAAALAVAGVALQTLAGGLLKAIGVAFTTVSWLVFLLDAGVMLTLSPSPARWARGHAFELVVLVATFPLWPLLAYRLLLLELLPALTLLEVAKLAKLAKVARAVRARSGDGVARVVTSLVLAAAVGTGWLVVTH